MVHMCYAQRLRRVAAGFITALPSQHDGYDTVLRPKTFRTAVYYRMYGKSGDLIVHHNAMRNLVVGVGPSSRAGHCRDEPVNASNLEAKSPREAQNRKHAKYDKDFKDSEDYIFGTLMWETLGAINSEGEVPAFHAVRFYAPDILTAGAQLDLSSDLAQVGGEG